MAFTRAERQQVYIKMAITGPSGSGKTMGALRLAFGLGKKVALIDTENGSGSLYAHVGHYDQQQIAAPFTVQKYIAAIQEAAAAGYDVLIIDSLSHAWAGDGGLLDQKSAKDSRGGNSFSNWADVSKVYEQFKSTLLQSPIHIIGTMRSKQEYVIEQDSRGKSTPRKVGLAPIQREGMEYEFTTVFDVDMTHIAATSKDRTGLFTNEINQITESHGKRLVEWLAGGSAAAPQPPSQENIAPQKNIAPQNSEHRQTRQPERPAPQPRPARPSGPSGAAPDGTIQERRTYLRQQVQSMSDADAATTLEIFQEVFGRNDYGAFSLAQCQRAIAAIETGKWEETDPFDNANGFQAQQPALMENG